MLEIIDRFFRIIVDAAFILQLVSVALASAIVFNTKIKNYKEGFVVLARVAVVTVFMLLVQLCIVLLNEYVKILTGVGNWISFLLGISLYAFAFSKQPTLPKAVAVNALFVTSFLVSMFGTTIGNVIQSHFAGFDIVYTKISADIFVLLFALVLRKYAIFRYDLNGFYSTLNIGCGILTVIICAAYNLYEIHVFGQNRQIFAPFANIFMACLYMINLFTYIMTYCLCKGNKELIELQGERNKNKYLEEMLNVSEGNTEEIRKVRHDLKNQYIYMQALLHEKRYDELEEYFTELSGTFAKPLFATIDSGNRSVDSVLNMEIDKASACGVKLDIKVAVPAQLPFDRTDICRLFANILDNAIEGVNRDNIEDPVVEVVCDVRGEYLRFSVVNPTRQTEDYAGRGTSKKDKLAHGYGNKIIKGIVNKYNGIYHHGVEGSCYVAEVMIDLLTEKGEEK